MRDGRVEELTADADHPFTRGGLCPKVNRFLEDRTYQHDRLLRPLRRTGSKGAAEFEPVSWEVALDEIAGRLGAVIDGSGGEAITMGTGTGLLPEDPSTRSVNMVQLGRALTGLEPPVRALVVYSANPAVTAPNQNLVRQGLGRDDLFTVVIDHVVTDTARYADYVLPATTQVEHHDMMWSWGHTYLARNEPAIDPVGEALPNAEIFRRLGRRMGFAEPAFKTGDEELVAGRARWGTSGSPPGTRCRW